VHGAGAERAQADARASRQTAVDVGDVGAALFVSNRNEVDRGIREGLVQIKRLLARNAEHVLDAFSLQTLDEHVRCFAGSHSGFDSNNAVKNVWVGRDSVRSSLFG